MPLYQLDKKVLSLKGNPVQFLNGLTSNTLDKSQNAFLNMHGRIIATFEQIRISDQEFLIVIAAQAQEALNNHVARYLKINQSTLQSIDLKVYFDLEGDYPQTAGDRVIPQKKGRMIISARNYQSDISVDQFTLFRLQHQIPLHTVDYQEEMLLNVHEHDFASYTKGCFLGQETVAKVHNRSKPTWVLTVRYADQLLPEQQSKMTSVQKDPVNGRLMGFAFIPSQAK